MIMGSKKPKKIEALVVNAIRRLQDSQGSSPREISSYISQEYGVPTSEIRKQVQLALKRGVTYGILQCLKGGNYTCNRDFITGPVLAGAGGDAITEIPCHGRRRRSRQKSYKSGRRAKRRRSRRKSKGRRGRSSGRRSKRRSRPATVMDTDQEVNEDPFEEGNTATPRKESASSIASMSEDENPDDPTGKDPTVLNAEGSVE